MMLFDSVMVHSLELLEKALRFHKHYDVAIRGLQGIFEELDVVKIKDNKNRNTNVFTSKNVIEDVASNNHESHPFSHNIIFLDPSHVTMKGCP
ncbi:Uncharacterized protein TCM_027860 [Theobroma cacao]|uniref:Uncharacterized protein n=1 Tax=Theobroma cacao TaxID=3641 RepID=A0A061G9U6_THECC|nr:Uncharacterized protein TCM_027860 [Theobroma cacao]